jgi:beta-fructofuranosidase
MDTIINNLSESQLSLLYSYNQITSDPKLKELAEYLNTNHQEKHKQIIEQTSTELNKIKELLKSKKPIKIYIDGVFDIIHSGHFNAIRQAKKLGDICLCGVNSDEDVLKVKGPTLMNDKERCALAFACKWCDEVGEKTPYTPTLATLDKYNCDYLSHGDDIPINEKGECCYDEIIHAPEGYSTTDFRDPQILRTDDGYIMLVGARKENEEESAIVYYESQDLENWTFKGDFYTSKDLYFMECPDVFELGNKYYMVFSWNNVVYYRVADSFFGPWEKPEIDTFDGNGFYAAKTCEYNGKRYLIGFHDRKKRESDSLSYTWAGSVLVYELRQLEDATLGVCMPEQYNEYFSKEIFSAETADKSLDLGQVPNTCHLSFDLTLEDDGRCELSFANSELNEEYKISVDNAEDNISYNAFPNFQAMKLEAGKTYKTDVVVEKDIVVIYVDGNKALSNRIYAAQGADWKLDLSGAQADNVVIYGK